MKVAIDISPTNTGHNVRGIGKYTQNLVSEFKKGNYKNIEFAFFENPASPPPADLIHYPYFDLFFRTLPIKSNANRVVTIHDVIPLLFPTYFPAGLKGKTNFFRQKLSLKNVEAIITVSKTSKKDIQDKLSVPEDKIHVIYSAPGKIFKKISNEQKLAHVVRKYKLPQNFVLYVGDVNWSKNIPNLLRAISKVEANLVLVGKALIDDSVSEVREINRLIDNLDIDNRIYKTGFVEDDDLAAVYSLASITILPSYYEGFGFPVLESMACGTPVVCSNIPALEEIGGESAIFCDPKDPNDIAKKIKQTLNSKDKLSTGLIKHTSSFTWEKTAENTIKVYKQISS